MDLEPVERRMLRHLQRDGRATNTSLAEAVGLSETPCLRRLRLLEQSGVIEGYRAVLDPARVGFPIAAFVLINTHQRTETDRRLFLQAVATQDRIVECAAVSGAHDFILKVVAADMDELADVTMVKLLGLPTVSNVTSSVIFKWIKKDGPLPV